MKIFTILILVPLLSGCEGDIRLHCRDACQGSAHNQMDIDCYERCVKLTIAPPAHCLPDDGKGGDAGGGTGSYPSN